MAANEITSIPISVDYTSRDYYSLRNDLIARVQARVPEWQGNDPTDFGMALVEAFSYLGDVCNYYIDRVANENFISTATQRQTVLNIAKTYGYSPSGWSAASTTLSFGNSSSSVDYTLPIGTQVSVNVNLGDTSYKLIFTTQDEVSVTHGTTIASGAAVATAINMQDASPASSYGVKLVTGSNRANQTYTIPADNVVQGYLSVFTTSDQTTFSLWSEVKHLGDYGPGDLVYESRIDANNQIALFFGDGISGAIPSTSVDIFIKYFTGGGAIGNIPVDTIRSDVPSIVYVPGWSTSDLSMANMYLSVTNNSAAAGGSDPESTNSIRVNAPKSLVAFNRAISLKDYENLAYSISGVGKAHAIATSNNVVSIFIAPYKTPGTLDSTPGILSPGAVVSQGLQNTINSVANFVQPKAQIGTTVLVNPPVYSPVTVESNFEVLPGFTSDKVLENLNAVLMDKFSYENVVFSSYFSSADIAAKLLATPGVKTLSVTSMYRTAATSSAGAAFLDAGDNEIFVFDALITTTPTEIYLNSLTAYQNADFNGISPTFVKATYNYSTTFATSGGGTPNATMTFDSGITVTLNGSAVTSGVAINLPNAASKGTHVYTILLTKDSVTRTYTLTATTGNYFV